MNHETFAVGEVAIYWCPGSLMHGEDITITGPLELRWFHYRGAQVRDYAYLVDAPSAHLFVSPGESTVAMPEHLRKKRPPQEEDARTVVKWSECPWQPSGVAV